MSCDFDSDSDALSVHALRDTIVSSLNQTSSKQQRFKGSTSTYPRHASASRQRPPNPPDTANRSLARKVEEVKAQLLRERNKCDHLQSLLDQDASVSEENKKLRLQIKELQVRLGLNDEPMKEKISSYKPVIMRENVMDKRIED